MQGERRGGQSGGFGSSGGLKRQRFGLLGRGVGERCEESF